MHSYTVFDVAPAAAGCTISLFDDGGQFHVASAIAAVPRVGARLLGNRPALGFGLLLGVPIDEVYRVTFKAVDCSRDDAQHPMQASPGR